MERSLYGSLSTVAGPLHDCRGSEWATLRVTFMSRTRLWSGSTSRAISMLTSLTKLPQIFQIFVAPGGQLVHLERFQIDISQRNTVQLSGNPIPPDDFRVYAG